MTNHNESRLGKSPSLVLFGADCNCPHQCSALYGTSFLPRNHTQQERYCGMAEAGERSETHDPPSGERESERDRRSTRTRRELKVRRECSLVLVADYLYFKSIGQEDRKKTLYAMVSFRFWAVYSTVQKF